jgi:hypothetical protein
MTIARPRLYRSLTVVAVLLGVSLIGPVPSAFAQRGGYGAMRGYQRFAQQQMQYVQKQVQAQQQLEKDQQDAFMKRFDTNKNGKIDGKEKGPAQKYLRELQMGKDPDKAIKSLGRSSSKSSSTRTKPASTK